MTWLNPYRWILLAALVAAVVLGVPIIVHRYDEARRDEGRAEVRAQDKAAAEAQTASNRDLQHLSELHYQAVAATQAKFFTKTITEIHDAAAPLAACPVPEPVRVRLNAAATCARGDSPGACGAGDQLPATR